MKSNILISVVIAAYNVVEYLHEAIDSVISQWDDDWELIVVNDGSTDGTTSLLKDYEVRLNSSRFVVINQGNLGIARVRDIGISVARGEYLAFLDGDDFYVDKRLQYIKYALLDNKPDCLIIDFNYYFGDHSSVPNDRPYYGLVPKKLTFYSDEILSGVYRTAQVYPWKHIFKTSIWRKYSHPLGRTYEDVSTIPLFISECASFFYLPLALIQYRQRDGSIMKIKSYDNVVHLSASLSYVTNELKDKYNQIPECIALEHSIFNLYLFTWACGDSLSNSRLNPRDLYPIFINNFHYSNLVSIDKLKKEMKRDKKTWRKFTLFYYFPSSYYLAFYLRHHFNKVYKLLNKLRNFVYKT